MDGRLKVVQMFKGALLRKSIFSPVLNPQPGEGIQMPLPFIVNGCSPTGVRVCNRTFQDEMKNGANVLAAMVTRLHQYRLHLALTWHQLRISTELLKNLKRLYQLSQ